MVIILNNGFIRDNARIGEDTYLNRMIMAKKKSVKTTVVNKTQLIREALKKSPNASPVEIANQLKSSGVTAQYVSTVKFNMKKKSGKGVTKSPARKSGGKAETVFTLSELVKASRLAEEVGGVDKAQKLLDAISKLS